MANEDVLEELYFWIGRVERDEPGAAEYLETLAAALREAREELARIKEVQIAAAVAFVMMGSEDDAAMKTTGGEGSGHE